MRNEAWYVMEAMQGGQPGAGGLAPLRLRAADEGMEVRDPSHPAAALTSM